MHWPEQVQVIGMGGTRLCRSDMHDDAGCTGQTCVMMHGCAGQTCVMMQGTISRSVCMAAWLDTRCTGCDCAALPDDLRVGMPCVHAHVCIHVHVHVCVHVWSMCMCMCGVHVHVCIHVHVHMCALSTTPRMTAIDPHHAMPCHVHALLIGLVYACTAIVAQLHYCHYEITRLWH